MVELFAQLTFVDEVGELEALYMGDLDTKLSRSNDAVNEGVDTEALSEAMTLAQDMDEKFLRTLALDGIAYSRDQHPFWNKKGGKTTQNSRVST